MPSFRVTIGVGPVRPGVHPADVLPTVADAAATLTVVEASDLQIVGGLPRIVVRFEAEDDEIARQVGEHALAVFGTIAEARTAALTRRTKNRWLPVTFEG